MTKKLFFMMAATFGFAAAASAGGLMTNTNYHIAFDRMMARGASMEIDAAYSNPELFSLLTRRTAGPFPA